MEHFSFAQIIEIRIHEYYNKNGGFGVAPLPILTKKKQAVYMPECENNDQFSPIQKSKKD